MKNIILILILLLSGLGFSQNEQLFEEANKLYNEGQYHEALDKYSTILESGNHSAELYFNMGNSHYKLNNIAPSIYYFEKALLLEPNDKEISNNIAFARNMTIDSIEKVPDVGLSSLINKWAKYFHYETWAKISVTLSILFVLLFVFYLFSNASSSKRFAFISSTVSLILVLATLGLTFHGKALVDENQPAIVFAKESQIKNEPNLRSSEAFKLHEGTKVQVLDTVDNWKKVKIADGKTGWVMSEDIKLIKNF
ncbi:MAG: tetratricopeptide repeat protein [Bacteroidota bacterium]